MSTITLIRFPYSKLLSLQVKPCLAICLMRLVWRKKKRKNGSKRYRFIAAQNLAAGTNWARLFERQQRPTAGAKDWEKILVTYRQQAENGDGSAMVYLADLMERGSTGVQNLDIALLLYQRGIDALNQPNADGGMAAVMLILYAQERLTEHHKAGRIHFSGEQRKQYLTLKEALSFDAK